MSKDLTIKLILLKKLDRLLNPNFNYKFIWALFVSGFSLLGYQRIIQLATNLEYISDDVSLKVSLSAGADYLFIFVGIGMILTACFFYFKHNKSLSRDSMPSTKPLEEVNFSSSMHSSNIIKLGLIGIGQATIPQLEAIKTISDFEFSFYSDKNTNIREELNKLGYRKIFFNTDYREMLHVDEINAIIVATESENHYEHAKSVLNSGKNLLLEKPATFSLNQLKELIQIAEDKQLCFVCSFHAAFDKTINWILDDVNIAQLHKEYGWNNELTKIKCEFYDPYIYDNSTIQKNRFSSLHDSWLDSGINALSVVSRFIMPDNISHKKSNFKMYSDDIYKDRIIDAEVEYSFNSIGIIYIHTSWIKNINRKVTTLTNDNIEIELDHTAQKITLNKDNNYYLIKEFEQNRLVNQYIALYEDFYSHLKNKTNNLGPAFKLHELLFESIK